MSPIPKTDIEHAWPYYDSYAAVQRKLQDPTLYLITEIKFTSAVGYYKNINSRIIFDEEGEQMTIRDAYNEAINWLAEPLPQRHYEELRQMGVLAQPYTFYKMRGDCLGDHKIIYDINIKKSPDSEKIALRIVSKSICS